MNPIVKFVESANESINQYAPAQKIDRVVLANYLNKQLPSPLQEGDALILLGIVLHVRPDIRSQRGKTGGTFKL